MGVLLQGFFKVNSDRAVPSPNDGDTAVPWWWDRLAHEANALRRAGFTAIWLPPVLKTTSGSRSKADGYGPFDDYDIGSKNQWGSLPTRFGSREALQRCVAMLRANGLDVYLDLVEHHRIGDPGNFVFRYKGADNVADIGRFPKDPLNFFPNVPRDPNLGGPPADDAQFGREFSPINAQPKDYVFNGLIDAADWLTTALDVQGYRLDDVKGLSTDFLRPFLNAKAMAGKFAVGEYFDGDVGAVRHWITNPDGMNGRVSAFDFPLRFMLARMCRSPGGFDMRSLDHAGLAGALPVSAVTFVENHDTDVNDSIAVNKMLAYAYILTSEGYPAVYWRDYSSDQECYGLKPRLDPLIWVHENLANGPTQQRWQDGDVFAYERLGLPGLLVGLNNDPQAGRTITVATNFGAHVNLEDYSGHGPKVTTDASGAVTIALPRNDDGMGYVCYSTEGRGGAIFGVNPRPVRQTFEGAVDLDLSPVDASHDIPVGRIFCAAGQKIDAALSIPDLVAPEKVWLTMTGPDGTIFDPVMWLAGETMTTQIGPIHDGFHTVRLSLDGAAAARRLPFALTLTYTAPSLIGELDEKAHRTPAQTGEWDDVFEMLNVAVHAHLLPSGNVLFWGRRDQPDQTLDEHACTPFVWDYRTGDIRPTQRPRDTLGDTVNLFCSGHTLMHDGKLLVTGGHFKDGFGIEQASLYDYTTNMWVAHAPMHHGRWYPTVVTLADGTGMVLSGSYGLSHWDDPLTKANTANNATPQVWVEGGWIDLRPSPELELFPTLHLAPDGRVFMSGPGPQSYFLDTADRGTWTPLAGGKRFYGRRDYAPAVMYAPGKIVYIGGGNEAEPPQIPTNAVEVIDLNGPAPTWRTVAPMHFPRRQHNATLLPDGTILVTGGSSGPGFNDLTIGSPVHVAELWDPVSETWTLLAKERHDRCYHATALLLPDATVLSAGSGEFAIGFDEPNPPADSHRDGQIFRPPYLFGGERPRITDAPAELVYGDTFDVGVGVEDDIARVTLLRLGSTTHTNNMNQRFNELHFDRGDRGLSVTAPERPEICPPGHYMLFVLNRQGVPSVAHMLHVAPRAGAGRVAPPGAPAEVADIETLDASVRRLAQGTRAVIGLTSKCPYGLGACWGGAFEALKHLDGIGTVDGVLLVRSIANREDNTADVFLGTDKVPDVDRWAVQITETANGSYDFRGVELAINGVVERQDQDLVLIGPAFASLPLRPLDPAKKIQFDRVARLPQPATPLELDAFNRLATAASSTASTGLRVTGPFIREGDRWALQVRMFAPQPSPP